MTASPRSAGLVGQVLRDPQSAAAFSVEDWDLLLRQARASELLGRIADRLGAVSDRVVPPDTVRTHFNSASILAAKHTRDVLWEVECVRRAVAEVGVHCLLLKGAAYVVADLPPAAGRLFTDVDILVPKARLGEVERILHLNGWIFDKMDAYDQQYYRRWMHQLPPMQHVQRQTVLDVHHTIVPETARNQVAAASLLDDAVEVPNRPGFWVLSPADMVLHSAVHLFNEGEFAHGLRDLSDLDLLMRHFAADPGFWQRLADRARQMDLLRPLHYALFYTRHMLETPIPDGIDAAGAETTRSMSRFITDAALRRALQPDHASCRDRWTGTALWMLYVRGHYLRMPPALLIPHLVRKAVRMPKGRTP